MRFTPWHLKGRSRSASALLLVLWAMFLLSMTILAWAKFIQRDIQISSEANHTMEALAMARSGLAMALHPQVTRLSPQLSREMGAQLGYKVLVVGEGGRLNLNWLLAGEDPRKLGILKKWLEQFGLDFQQREALVDCLLDYIDADSTRRLNGEEESTDYHPANRPLLTLEEIEQVAASEPLTSRPGWKNAFTLLSSGPVDLTSASPEILRTLPGLGDPVIERFVTFRNGKDGQLGTEDDPVFKNLKEVQSFFGMNDNQFRALSGLVAIKDPVIRVTSEGHSGKVIRQLMVVARKSGAKPAILYWKE